MEGRFERNDRVRMQRKMALYLTRHGRKPNHLGKINWLARQGTVVRISVTSDQIGVLWDDRATVDPWPPAALEKL